jgi:Tfp pilus assembly protein PilO
LLAIILFILALLVFGFVFTVYFQLNKMEKLLNETHAQMERYLKYQYEKQKKEEEK